MNWLQVKSNSSVIHSNLVLNATTTSITLGEYSNDIAYITIQGLRLCFLLRICNVISIVLVVTTITKYTT